MWRAFFYAVGYMTIFVGLQSLAFERVQLAPGKDAKQFIKRILGEDGAESVATSSEAVGSPVASRTAPLATGSSFGPSRFSNGGFGGSAFSAAPYRDLDRDVNLGVESRGAEGIPRIDLAGYQSNVRQPAVRARSTRPGRVIMSQDWMPWSLLAIGAVIVLYTRSFGTHS